MKLATLQNKLVFVFTVFLFMAVGTLTGIGFFSAKKTNKFVLDSAEKSAEDAAKKELLAKAETVGLSVKSELEGALISVRTLADPRSILGKDTWVTSLAVPIIANETFYGIAGADMPLDFIQSLVTKINTGIYSGSGRTAVISSSGILAAASDNPGLKGKHIREWTPGWEKYLNIIRQGTSGVFEDKDYILKFRTL
ncbi:MAG: hypothetical protein GY749_05730 [Desulfobacteraceae bacterium]|nr:hypothetical protein [Desulfobacteraceae bacterium]